MPEPTAKHPARRAAAKLARAPLDCETFVRGTMATGNPPKAKRPAKKRKARK